MCRVLKEEHHDGRHCDGDGKIEKPLPQQQSLKNIQKMIVSETMYIHLQNENPSKKWKGEGGSFRIDQMYAAYTQPTEIYKILLK